MLLSAVVLGLASWPLASAQSTPQAAERPPARGPVILSAEVDRLIDAIRRAAQPDGGLGDGTCRQTAMVLTAAGHCHRFYHAGDGPWLRRGLESLFVHRRADGSFANSASDDGIATTRWVIAALQVLDPFDYKADIEAGREFLRAKRAPQEDPFGQLVDAMLEQTRSSEDRARALTEQGRAGLPPSETDLTAATAALVHAVSCQAAARGVRRDHAANEELAQTWLPAQEKGFGFVVAQHKDGVFGVQMGDRWVPDVGLTGLCLSALQTKPVALRSREEQTAIDQGLAWLLSQQSSEDGSFGERTVNYSTCSAVMALGAADQESFREPLAKAQRYLLALQNVEPRDYAPSDRDYGSIGYGGDQRGDLSNLQFALEALTATGLAENHEAFAKAIVFLQRTQNLREYNDFKGRTRSEDDGSWREVAPGNDGGAAYYPGNSPAGYRDLPDGTRIPRSYGSMTYALLKAYILCGLPADDPRIQAAVGWIRKNWDLSVNPGVDPKLGEKASYQGLYYYYMVVAQALDAAGLAAIEVTGDPDVDWRRALREHLEKRQREDGSWINSENERWWEDQPLLCTAYAMLALSKCSPRGEDK